METDVDDTKRYEQIVDESVSQKAEETVEVFDSIPMERNREIDESAPDVLGYGMAERRESDHPGEKSIT